MGESGNDKIVQDYQFHYLCLSRELAEARKKLECPILGLQAEGTVVLITRSHGVEMVGAAQIYDGSVVCIQGIGATPLTMDAILALRAWYEAERIGLFDDDESNDG